MKVQFVNVGKAVLLASVAAISFTPAAAQTTPAGATEQDAVASEQGAPQDIIVTAQGRSQRLQDVPVAVSVVSGAALADGSILTLADMAARLPAVRITPGPLTAFLNIRGVGSGQNAGFEQSVATFVDGIYRGRSQSIRASLFDVERVEVLKGPQTTFFGNNAIAGALNIATRKPGRDLEYNASGLYAFGDGEFNLEGGVSAPISDALSVRIAGRYSGMEGYITNQTTGRDSPRQRDALGRISFRFEPTSDFRSDLRVDVGKFRARGALDTIILNCPSPFGLPGEFVCGSAIAQNGGPLDNEVKYTSFAPSNFTSYDFQEVAFTNALQLGDMTLTSTTGYFHHKYDTVVELIPTNLRGVGGNTAAPSPYIEYVDQFSQELRLQSATGGTFEWMAGAYYSTLKTDLTSSFGAFFLPFGAFNPTGTTTAATPVGANNRQKYDDRTISVFASATIRPIENLRVNFGARYTNVRKNGQRLVNFGNVTNGDIRGLTPFDPITQLVFGAILGSDAGDFPDPRRTDDRFLPSVGLQYDLTPDIMAYGTFSKGFKAGGFSGANTINTYDPETVNAYELGLKSSLFDRRLTVNIAAFLSDYKDLQETTITFNPLPVNGVANAASSRSQGIEVGSTLRVSPTFSISADLAYLDSKYRDYPNGVCNMAQTFAAPAGCVQDLSGKQRPYAPEWSGNVTADLRIPLGTNQIQIQPTAYFTSRFFTTATADPLLQQEGNTKFDLRVSFGPASEKWEFAVLGKNLTDEKTAFYRSAQLGANGSAFALADRPRSIAIQLTIKN